MAVMAETVKKKNTPQPLTPLSWIESQLFWLLILLSGKEARQQLQRRKRATHRSKENAALKVQLEKELERDAIRFAGIIVDTWTRLGERSATYSDGTAKPRDRRKVERVRFEAAVLTPEQIWLKVLITEQGLFGWRNALPYRVRAVDLIEDKTLEELALAVRRKVTAKLDHETGLFIVVHRSKATGAIPESVKFRDILPFYPADLSDGPLVLGVREYREVVTIDLEKTPHVLVAGETGGGKSNMINNIISQIIRFYTPSEFKLLLIDPKQLEFIHYESLPHLMRDVVLERDDAAYELTRLAQEFTARTSQLSKRKVKNISDWNKRYPNETLPRILVVIDEFGLLINRRSEKASTTIKEIVTDIMNAGRAVGIHLMVCAQRPAKSVLPMEVRGQSVTIGGRTSDMYMSQIIFNNGELALLPEIPGRMKAKVGGKGIEIQTPHVLDSDVAESLSIARGRDAGVISLESYEPTINHDGLVNWIWEKHEGLLAPNYLAPKLRELGVDTQELKQWLNDVRKLESLQIGRRTFAIVKSNGTFRLKLTQEIIQDIELPPEPTPEADAPPILALPAPKFDLVDGFIKDVCDASEGKKTTAAKLYEKFVAYCKHKGVDAMAKNKFGMELKARGFMPKRSTGGVYWWLGIGFPGE